MTNKQRTKSWELTQDRALQLYEMIQETLDPSSWEVFIKSEGRRMSLGDFLESAKKRIIYFPENSKYNPSVVADDSLLILDSLKAVFDNIKTRMEDSFRSILVVNEDMNNFVESIETTKQEITDNYDSLKQENESMQEQIKSLTVSFDKVKEGITPLTDVIKLRVKEIIKLYKEFKECIGDEKEMNKFLPIFESEVENTIKLINMKQNQVLNSTITWESDDTSTDTPVPEEVSSLDLVPVVDEVDTSKVPANYLQKWGEFNKVEFKNAIATIKRDVHWTDDMYWTEVGWYMECKEHGKKYRPKMR